MQLLLKSKTPDSTWFAEQVEDFAAAKSEQV